MENYRSADLGSSLRPSRQPDRRPRRWSAYGLAGNPRLTLAFTPLKLSWYSKPVLRVPGRSRNLASGDRCRGGNDPGQGWITGQTHGLVIDDVAVLVEMKIDRSGEQVTAPLLSHPEETRSVDRDIERIVGGGDIALGKLLLDRRQRHPDSDLAGSAAGQELA